ncbi:MAG: hypothetical protein LRZ84_10555 [Desertifilum sp.]|nr:hypothetical protein [Desertifilum sp.]
MTEVIARDWYQRGHLTTTGYILAIKGLLKPFSDRFEIENVSAFCEQWGIKRASFYRAISKLKADNEIDWETTTNITITIIDVTTDEEKAVSLSHKRNIKASPKKGFQ